MLLPFLALLSEDATYQLGIKLCANEEFIDFSIFPSIFCKLKPNQSTRKKHLVKRGEERDQLQEIFYPKCSSWYSWIKPGGQTGKNGDVIIWINSCGGNFGLCTSLYIHETFFCPLQRIPLLTDPTDRARKIFHINRIILSINKAPTTRNTRR